ncbi:MAG: PAS domain-containing protein [Chloroflexota bacterium]
MTADTWNLLLVDDDDDDQFLLIEMLRAIQRRKTRVDTAQTYRGGLEKLREGAFDAVLLDYDLGGKNGVQWIREALAQGCKAPVIMVTGRGRYEVDLEAMQAGAADYLTKADLSPTLLERAIRYAIERKQTEAELRAAKDELELRVALRTQEVQEREDLLKHVLEILPVGVWITDAAGVILRGNPASREIWAGARYVGIEQYGEYKGWWLDSGRQIQPEEWAVARAISCGETSLNEEIEIECFDGTRKIILNSALPITGPDQQIRGAIIVNQDITTRKAIETRLHRTNELLEELFNNLHLGVAHLDREFNFVRVNRTYAGYDGRDVQFFEGKNHFALYPNAENEAIFRQVVESGQAYVTFGKPFVYPDNPGRGMTYWDWSIQPVCERDGTISGLIFCLLDVTEREMTIRSK